MNYEIIGHTNQKIVEMNNMECCVFLFIKNKIYYTVCSQATYQKDDKFIFTFNKHELKRKKQEDIYLSYINYNDLYDSELNKKLNFYLRKLKINKLLNV